MNKYFSFFIFFFFLLDKYVSGPSAERRGLNMEEKTVEPALAEEHMNCVTGRDLFGGGGCTVLLDPSLWFAFAFC